MTIPVYPSHRDASCFRCSGMLDDPRETGFAYGRGQFSAVCVNCTKLSFYDLDYDVNFNEIEWKRAA